MSRNIKKFELKPAKTINLKGDFKTLLKEKALTELESSSQRKSIKRFSSQKKIGIANVRNPVTVQYKKSNI